MSAQGIALGDGCIKEMRPEMTKALKRSAFAPSGRIQFTPKWAETWV